MCNGILYGTVCIVAFVMAIISIVNFVCNASFSLCLSLFLRHSHKHTHMHTHACTYSHAHSHSLICTYTHSCTKIALSTPRKSLEVSCRCIYSFSLTSMNTSPRHAIATRPALAQNNECEEVDDRVQMQCIESWTEEIEHVVLPSLSTRWRPIRFSFAHNLVRSDRTHSTARYRTPSLALLCDAVAGAMACRKTCRKYYA